MIRFIAEAGQTMRGDVGLAVEMVHAFAEAGATHFKVQMLNPDTIATGDAASYWKTGPIVSQRQSFANNGVIPYDAWGPVRDACDVAGIGFVATPFDLAAVHALAALEPAAVKVASGDITFLPLLREIALVMHPEIPILMSTGASTPADFEIARQMIVRHRPAAQQKLMTIVPFACTLAYPTPVTHANLGRIHDLRAVAEHVGYSDHTTEEDTSMIAVVAGATWLEKHVSPFPGEPYVPDDVMALGTSSFYEYVMSGLAGQALLGDSFVDAIEEPARVGARRAARFAADYPAGRPIDPTMCTYLRPDPTGDGHSIVLSCSGVHTTRDVSAGELVSEENVQ